MSGEFSRTTIRLGDAGDYGRDVMVVGDDGDEDGGVHGGGGVVVDGCGMIKNCHSNHRRITHPCIITHLVHKRIIPHKPRVWLIIPHLQTLPEKLSISWRLDNVVNRQSPIAKIIFQDIDLHGDTHGSLGVIIAGTGSSA